MNTTAIKIKILPVWIVESYFFCERKYNGFKEDSVKCGQFSAKVTSSPHEGIIHNKETGDSNNDHIEQSNTNSIQQPLGINLENKRHVSLSFVILGMEQSMQSLWYKYCIAVLIFMAWTHRKLLQYSDFIQIPQSSSWAYKYGVKIYWWVSQTYRTSKANDSATKSDRN